MQELPAEFLERQSRSLSPDEFRLFARSLDSVPPVSIRLNPFKSPAVEGERIAWCDEGIYLPARPVFTVDPLFHAGAYYVQEASSMFTGWLAARVLENYPSPRILDLCAAPGGKTTHLAALAGVGGVVVANEVIRSRAGILVENVKKWGSGNIAVTLNDPADMAKLRGFFDLVVVDAPCSGEGMFRKDTASRGQWSADNVALCASRQRRILSDVWGALRGGGVLIYSTCTFNRSENEENALWIAGELGGETLAFDSVPDGVTVSDAGYRFYPHLTKGEGFYAVALRKRDEEMRRESFMRRTGNKNISDIGGAAEKELNRWVGTPLRFAVGGDTVYGFSEPMRKAIDTIRGNLNLLYSGVAMGGMIHGKLKPSHPLALYHDLDRQAVVSRDVERGVALDYLRRHDTDPALFEEGLSLVTFTGTAIGWIKRIGRRCNNLYPCGWRILNY